MWKVLIVLTVLTTNSECYSKKHKTTLNRNQRIIKVQGPPHYNHFYGPTKPIRKRPFGPSHGDEFIRPNHPPPIPPFFNGPSTNHIKHLSRPPPHVFHKSPSYGLGYPYKSLNSYRPIKPKEKFRIPSISTLSIRPSSLSSPISSSISSNSVSSTTTYHSPTFTSSFASPPTSHIISSDDNNGPIREIPAPNLGPKSHETSLNSVSVISDISGIGAVPEVSGIAGISGVNGIGAVSGVSGIGGISGVGGYGIGGIDGVSALSGVKIHGIGNVGGGVGGVLHTVSDISEGNGIHVNEAKGAAPVEGVIETGGVNIVNGASVLHGVGGGAVHGYDSAAVNVHEINAAGGSIHEISTDGGVGAVSNIASVGGVTHLEPEELLHTVAKNPNGINLDAIVRDQGITVNTYLKESLGDSQHGNDHKIEIANFDEGSSIDVTNLIKNAAGSSNHHSSYEVTEHHNHFPSNDQIIKGHDGTKLYYAPDPDPSLPVHKVPPTNDPHSTPSNGQNHIYAPQVQQGYSYIQGGSIGTPLSSEELFHLMHGYPTVISQPVVAFVGQPQTQGVFLSGAGHNYFQQSSNSYGGSHYSQNEQGGNDISQYLQQPEIHDLIHNSDSHHEQESVGSSQSQSVYSPQNQYQNYLQNQYQTSLKAAGSNLETSNQDISTQELNHNYQYEPEASETDNRNSYTVIRQTNEGSLSSGTVKKLLLEDSASSESKTRGSNQPESVTTVLQIKNVPEVPFYASLPSKKAAETLASLQAAGSVANDYINEIKIMRGDQESEKERFSNKRLGQNDGRFLKSESGNDKTIVDIQKSLPLYETSITSKNLVDDGEDEEQSEYEYPSEGDEGKDENEGESDSDFSNIDFKEIDTNETFGKRLRPK